MYGKLDSVALGKSVLPYLGSRRPDVLVGPEYGVDVSILKIGREILALKNDPLFVYSKLGIQKSAWAAFHTLASDIVTSGLSPTHLILDLEITRSLRGTGLSRFMSELSAECAKFGVSIIGGHTARYSGLNRSVVGSGTMLGVGRETHYVTTRNARAGDDIIVTKYAGAEAASYISYEFADAVKDALGRKTLSKVRSMFFESTTVKEALALKEEGLVGKAVSSMHDVTEGGILGATHELTSASGCGCTLELDLVPTDTDVNAVLGLFELDCYTSTSEGSLLITTRQPDTRRVLSFLESLGTRAQVIGRLEERRFGSWVKKGESSTKLGPAGSDRYWKLFTVSRDREKIHRS